MNFARTKIQPPRPRGGALVERPELEARLGAALLDQRLVLVVAAAGYGKTAALTRQIERLPPGVALAWVSADEGDDLHRLLDCLIAALEPWDPPWRTAPEALMALAARPGNGALQAAATELLNTLDTTDAEHGVIVLDDLHRVDDPAVYEFLNLVLARLGPRWTLAIAARHDPPLALARLRAQGELAEFRQADLQFARSETRMLAGLAGLDEASADALLARTQGWAAGLRLAINGARAGAARATAIDRHVFEFLASEVIDRLDPELQDFLLQTSVLPELSAPRCAAVTGNPEAPALLERVDRLCLFSSCLAPGDGTPDEAPTLRLHDLFREALEHRLARHDPQALPRLLKRAADSESDPLRRVNLLLRAADLDGAAKVLREHAPTWLTEGALSTVGRLIDRFPTAWRETSPELLQVCGLYAWARWDYYAMDDAMRRAESASRAAGDDDGVQAALAYQSIAASGLGRLGDNGPRLAVLRREVMRPETQAVVLVACLWHALDLGSVHRVGPLLVELIDLVEGSTDVSLWYRAYPIARINGLPGTQRALDRYVEGALRLTSDRPTVARALALTQRGWREAWAGHMDDAVDTLAQARADASWLGDPPNLTGTIQLLAAFVAALRGEHETARRVIREAVDDHPRGRGDWSLWGIWLYAGRLACAAGRADDLREALDAMRRLRTGAQALPTFEPPTRVLEANLAMFEGRAADAIQSWQDALDDEPRIDRLGLGIETRVRLAAALLEAGRLDDAAIHLRPVFLRLAEHGGVGVLQMTRSLLSALATAPWGERLDGQALVWLADWAHRFGNALPTAPPATPPLAAVTPRPAGLSEREFAVLERIAQGDSNKLIARAFDLSPHTVKRHVANILDKLGVTSRGQAAAWFRALA